MILRFSGRQRSFIVDQESVGQQGEVQDEALAQPVHSRMLKDVTTSDYGTYDPTPSMEKPHFKLIPNWSNTLATWYEIHLYIYVHLNVYVDILIEVFLTSLANVITDIFVSCCRREVSTYVTKNLVAWPFYTLYFEYIHIFASIYLFLCHFYHTLGYMMIYKFDNS